MSEQRPATDPMPIAVLVSGEGSNLQAIVDTVHGQEAEIVAVATDKPACNAIKRAAAAGIATAEFPVTAYEGNRTARDSALADWLESQHAQLIVLAGYMQILSEEFVRRFHNQIVNVHPSLLPAFPGVHAIEQALEHGVKVTGVTVHFVDEGTDTGPIIAQRAYPIEYPVTLEHLEAELHDIEHDLLPQAIRDIAAGRVHISPHNPRVVLGGGGVE